MNNLSEYQVGYKQTKKKTLLKQRGSYNKASPHYPLIKSGIASNHLTNTNNEQSQEALSLILRHLSKN